MNLQDGTDEKPGILPRALNELFHQASFDNLNSLSFSMSMLEVYMGHVRDLLAPKPLYRAYEALTRWYYIQPNAEYIYSSHRNLLVMILTNSTTATSTFKQIQRDRWKLRVSQMFQFQILQRPDGGILRGDVLDPLLGLM